MPRFKDTTAKKIHNSRIGNLGAKYKLKRCENINCGKLFLPLSGRAKYCPDCRRHRDKIVKPTN